MADKPLSHHDLDVHISDILDEILYRDPCDAIQQTYCEDGCTKIREIITFADGSKLTLTAAVPLPPLSEMTENQVHTIKLDGTKGKASDDGLNEALGLARHSMALRLITQISSLLDSLPQREKITCPTCEGHKWCGNCGGMGCEECKGTGLCQDCGGRGKIAIL